MVAVQPSIWSTDGNSILVWTVCTTYKSSSYMSSIVCWICFAQFLSVRLLLCYVIFKIYYRYFSVQVFFVLEAAFGVPWGWKYKILNMINNSKSNFTMLGWNPWTMWPWKSLNLSMPLVLFTCLYLGVIPGVANGAMYMKSAVQQPCFKPHC